MIYNKVLILLPITHSVVQAGAKATPCPSCPLHSLKLCHAHFCNCPSCWQTRRAGICPGGSTQIYVQDLLECPKRSIYPFCLLYSFPTMLLQCCPLKEGILYKVEESKVAFFGHFVPLTNSSTTDSYFKKIYVHINLVFMYMQISRHKR